MTLSFLLCARTRSRDHHAALVPQATRGLIGLSLVSPLEYADFIRQTSQEIGNSHRSLCQRPARCSGTTSVRNGTIRNEVLQSIPEHSTAKYSTEVIVAWPDSKKEYSDT